MQEERFRGTVNQWKALEIRSNGERHFLSAEELANQARISDGGLTVEQALGLIASYYPALMKHKELL